MTDRQSQIESARRFGLEVIEDGNNIYWICKNGVTVIKYFDSMGNYLGFKHIQP